MDLKSLYTDMLLQESNNKANRRELESPTFSELGHNPNCGDEINLHVEMDGEIIKDASFTGEGCAISRASTSMMIDLIKGKNIHEAKELTEKFIGMIKKEVPVDDDLIEALGDAVVLENVSNMPARVKCAVLAWHTLSNIIDKNFK
ncbi:Fe-S cluster assembly sulfur transfer protein SufU [Peptostreptococcus canis]|uniref:SUF system NifU family Fe-S cluster assembly protein n=1 Tax=Peptostreptococcus canis TaxID=1159213 RepID=A0ABR6TL64_9FIRM|nr:SUF system NifU family Fe-S cluster assembly protein [Peptostreptococcus canis]MBC2576137.1 SUF system NifU family Fe-S cluster assembly protein [Peptostreptococcus canis]MBP1998330.1 nitrogen fixation NifU-like protein [Peptostreptococcus canis]